MAYDYRAGKKRIKDILDNDLDVIDKKKLPNDENFTFDNACYSWVSAIFVDIRDSTKLFNNEDKKVVSKIIRAFTSEVIEILRDDDNLREIGIRGDCVYAIYTTPTNASEHDLYEKTVTINTLINMLNTMFNDRGFNQIAVGIGLSTAQELVVKAGRKGANINNKVWIGSAVTKASKFSSIANKNGIKPIVISDSSYSSIIEIEKKEQGDDCVSWFTSHYDANLGTYYDCSVIKTQFSEWIKKGMTD